MIHPAPTAQTRFWFALSKVLIFMGAMFYLVSAVSTTYSSFMLTTAITGLSVGAFALIAGTVSRILQHHVAVPAATNVREVRLPLAFHPRNKAISTRLGA